LNYTARTVSAAALNALEMPIARRGASARRFGLLLRLACEKDLVSGLFAVNNNRQNYDDYVCRLSCGSLACTCETLFKFGYPCRHIFACYSAGLVALCVLRHMHPSALLGDMEFMDLSESEIAVKAYRDANAALPKTVTNECNHFTPVALTQEAWEREILEIPAGQAFAAAISVPVEKTVTMKELVKKESIWLRELALCNADARTRFFAFVEAEKTIQRTKAEMEATARAKATGISSTTVAPTARARGNKKRQKMAGETR